MAAVRHGALVAHSLYLAVGKLSPGEAGRDASTEQKSLLRPGEYLKKKKKHSAVQHGAEKRWNRARAFPRNLPLRQTVPSSLIIQSADTKTNFPYNSTTSPT